MGKHRAKVKAFFGKIGRGLKGLFSFVWANGGKDLANRKAKEGLGKIRDKINKR